MKHVSAAIGALGMVVVGCSSRAPTALPIGIHSDASGTFTTGADASTSGLSVAVTPAAPSVCPGECVTLAATASGGRPPYAFAWLPEGASDGGDITVCPSETTTYGVNATDSSGSGGELQQANLSGSANVTVTVEASCSGGGAPVDSGHGGQADAGTEGPAPVPPWTGCEDLTGQMIDPTAGAGECDSPDANPVYLNWAIPLAKPFVRGQSYDVTITVSARVIDGPPDLDVWSSSSSADVACQLAQPLTRQALPALPLGGTVTRHFCATAQVDAPALFVGFAFPVIFSGTQGIGTTAISASACAVPSCAGDP